MKIEYFHDGQLRRVMKHVIALFSGFQVRTGTNDDGSASLRKVPCRFGDLSRQVGMILSNNSENTMAAAPFMTVDIEKWSLNRADIRAPVTQELLVTTKKINDDGDYINEIDKKYHVSRFNPIPYDLEFKLDIWTTNTRNKTELLEQIQMHFGPSVVLQLTTNQLDWSGTLDVELLSTDWTSRNRPEGLEWQIDVATLHFKTVMWLTPPAKVRESDLIHQHNVSFFDTTDPFDQNKIDTVVHTPTNVIRAEIVDGSILDYEITLLTVFGNETTATGDKLSWSKLFEQLGDFQDGISQMRLQRDLNDPVPIVGTIAYPQVVGVDDNKLILTIDPSTLPEKTKDDINGFIDPVIHFPDNTIDTSGVLPVPELGQRYVIVGTIDLMSVAWGNSDSLIAKTNDIIEYDGTEWFISFDSQVAIDDEVLYNLSDNKLYSFDSVNGWYETVYAVYRQGLWKTILKDNE